MSTIRIAKKFNEVVKNVEFVNDGGSGFYAVTLFAPYYMEPDANLQITVEKSGVYCVPKKHFREYLDKIQKKTVFELHLMNDQVSVHLRWAPTAESNPGFTIRDLTDMNNEPTCFNRSYTNINHALCEMQRIWSDKVTMGELLEPAIKYGIHVHHYCARD